MKTCKYKIAMVFGLLSIIGFGQTYDKKVSEKFKVNGDVALVLNSSYTDVEITTWNRNEVSIEAVMEVEGVSKEEANKALAKWNFEALGNKSTVKITSLSEDNAFNFDFPDLDIVIPEINFEMPELPELPELPEMPEIPEIGEVEFDYETYKNDSTYLKRYKKQVKAQIKKFQDSGWKEQMDSIRNTEEYKRNLEEFKRAKKEMTIEMNKLKNSEEFKESMEEARRAGEEARMEMIENKELMKEQLLMAKEASRMAMKIIEEMEENGTFDSIQKFSENIYFNYRGSSNSKIKIKKYIKIRVPKNATFKLNVRHGKLNIPDSNKKMSVNMSYGDFTGGMIVGSNNELIISNSPIVINTLKSANITLKNVPNATFRTLNNVSCMANYTDVVIENIEKNNSLSNKFGSLVVMNITSDFDKMNVILDYAKANINLKETPLVFQVNTKKSNLKLPESAKQIKKYMKNDVEIVKGYNNQKASSNELILTGIYSTVLMN